MQLPAGQAALRLTAMLLGIHTVIKALLKQPSKAQKLQRHAFMLFDVVYLACMFH